MPIGVPSVAYRMPGSPYEQWISIYERLFRGADHFFCLKR